MSQSGEVGYHFRFLQSKFLLFCDYFYRFLRTSFVYMYKKHWVFFTQAETENTTANDEGKAH